MLQHFVMRPKTISVASVFVFHSHTHKCMDSIVLLFFFFFLSTFHLKQQRQLWYRYNNLQTLLILLPCILSRNQMGAKTLISNLKHKCSNKKQVASNKYKHTYSYTAAEK